MKKLMVLGMLFVSFGFGQDARAIPVTRFAQDATVAMPQGTLFIRGGWCDTWFEERSASEGILGASVRECYFVAGEDAGSAALQGLTEAFAAAGYELASESVTTDLYDLEQRWLKDGGSSGWILGYIFNEDGAYIFVTDLATPDTP